MNSDTRLHKDSAESAAWRIRLGAGAAVFFGVLWAFCPAAADDLPFRPPADFNTLPVTALVETTKGPFEIKFYRRQAPVSVANFQHVAKAGMYDNVPFHRYVPGMLIQGGDPTRTKRGGPKWTLAPEITDEVRHVRGSVGWARLDEKINPERRSNASQFYITLRPVQGLDGFYTIFAQVIRGMENVDRLREGDKIIDVKFPKQGAGLERYPRPGNGSKHSTGPENYPRPEERYPRSEERYPRPGGEFEENRER